MAVDPVSRLEFMLHALEHTQERIANMSIDDFGDDHTLVEATLFNLAVIGKSARLLPEAFTAAHPAIPWTELAGLWDIVVNHCMNFEVYPPRVWNTVMHELLPLAPHLRAIINDLTGRATMIADGLIDG